MTSDDEYQRASELLARGFAELAFQGAQRGNRKFPDDPRHLIVLGQIEFRMGQLARAAERFTRALELTGPNAGVYFFLSQSMMMQGNDDAATKYLASALTLDPLHPKILKAASDLLVKLGRSAGYKAGRGLAVVTGAAQGIGRAVVERLASLGFECVALDLDGALLHAFCAEAAGRGQPVRPVVANVSDRQSVRAALSGCVSIDVLVNNAAIIRETPLLQITETEICDLLMNNTVGAMIVMQEALPKMARGSRVVTVGNSGAGDTVFQPRIAHYLASKGALAGFWGGSIVELAERGIMTHMVQPGLIDTRMQRWRGTAPPTRITPPSAVAEVVAAFSLRHDALPFVTGLKAQVG